MAGYRTGRVTEDVKRELGAAIRELKDPRVSSLVSVVKISLANDLSHCKVYVSHLEGAEQTERAVEGLVSASGLLRRQLSTRLQLRKSPALEFIADDSIAYGTQINQMIRDLNLDSPAESEEESPRED